MDAFPAFDRFLDDTLPSGEGGHILAIGENHEECAHLEYLTRRLPELSGRWNVSTIGMELDTFMNVFFWAYRDGRLPVPRGEETAYMERICMAYRGRGSNSNAQAFSGFIVTALNQSPPLRVVAYDVRELLEDDKRRIEEYRDWENSIHPDQPKLSWLLGQVSALLEENPDYARRLEGIENVVRLGRKKRIGMDAISATLLHAMSPVEGNRLTIGGTHHISGVAGEDSEGTFDYHLSKVGGPFLPKVKNVSKALLVMDSDIAPHSRHMREGVMRVQTTPLKVFDIAQGRELEPYIPKYNAHYNVPENKFRYLETHENPLVDEDIEQMALRVAHAENEAWRNEGNVARAEVNNCEEEGRLQAVERRK